MRKAEQLTDTPTPAEYAGAVSRYLDLAGLVPDPAQGENKAAAEFDAFNRHLDQLADERRRIQSLEF